MALAYIDPWPQHSWDGLSSTEERVLNRAVFVVGLDRRTVLGYGKTRWISHRRDAVLLVMRRQGVGPSRLAWLFSGRHEATVFEALGRAPRSPETMAWAAAIERFIACSDP